MERLLFTFFIAFEVPGAGTAMVTWLGVKMIPDWKRITKRDPHTRAYAFSSLLGGAMSMFWALIGGLICKGSIWWCPIDGSLKLNPKWLQAIPVLLTLVGTFMIAFGLKIRRGISDDLDKKLETDKKDLGSPTDIKQHTFLILFGLLFISFAALIQLWFIFCF